MTLEDRLPIKVVVNRFIKEPMLMINQEHYAKLDGFFQRREFKRETDEFVKALQSMVCDDIKEP